jgi:thiol:disulfide interchange protein DsbC
MRVLILLGLLLVTCGSAAAFTADGCGAGKCSDCHSLDAPAAAKLLGNGVERVLRVEFSEVPGFWLVEVEKEGKRFPLFVDFSKSYVVAGSVFRLKDGVNIAQQGQGRSEGSNANAKVPEPPKKVAISRIPLDDALIVGNPQAKTRVIVFTDPQCPFCSKLHDEIKEVVKRDPAIAFYIKLFPLKMHPNAYAISKSILCARSLDLLEASFSGAPLAPPSCETTVVDANLALGEAIGIRSTPTLILPDGTLLPGYKKAPELLRLLGSKVTPVSGKR